MRAAGVLRAEVIKVGTLPAVMATIAVMIVAGPILTASLQAADPSTSVNALVVTVTPFLQAGFIVLGLLPVAHEYSGRQIRTSLAAVPRRTRLLGAKLAVTVAMLAVTAVAVYGASTLAAIPASESVGTVDWAPLVGAVVYVVLIGVLSYSVALVLRQMVPALVTMLAAVLVLSPLLAGVDSIARWLPDRAASTLYRDDPGLLSTGVGAAVALVWIAGIGLIGAVLFLRRDS